ncbi:MAG TPA: thioredoxin-dependent thiol peroxidase [Longimicrobiales bacterium]|nr:thioredoxin-dependent thiol peroxidase [Longimicrobiales bacterium]
MLTENDIAPDFTLSDQHGNAVTLSALRGRPVVLYFYPKDDTPGCTTQACDVRDRIGDLQRTGAVVLGVSPDSVVSHRKFADKYALTFPLLADTEHEVAEAYGVWHERSIFGRKIFTNDRTTFVIDPEGRIRKVLPKVSPDAHVDRVLEVL